MNKDLGMDGFKVDEEYLASIKSKAEEFIGFVRHCMQDMSNKEIDIFSRYMAFSRLKTIIISNSFFLDVFKDVFVSGHDICHPFFNTDEFKKAGWDKFKLERMDFFCKENEDNPGH